MKEFKEMVSNLIKPGEAIAQQITAEQLNILHMAVGVSGEAGELLDCVKKYAIYNKPLDRENAVEELGDIMFYMEGLMQALDITQEECIVHNMKKLGVRYKDGYSDQAAQERADKKNGE